MAEKVKILNIDILSIRKQDLLEQLESGVLFTPNVDHVVRLQKDRAFYDAYQHADWVICDSVILHRFSKLLKTTIIESIPGSTFFEDFCDYHRKDPDYKIFILGGKEGVAKQAQKNINERMGRQMVVGAHSPSFQFVENNAESQELVRMVNGSGATLLVVCATSPKQEIWIAKYRQQLPCVKLFMALGATVDFEAGTVKRCPIPLQRMGMEWLWRFCQEPRRLFRRYFVRDMQFFWYLSKQMLGLYKNPFA
jgi:exopolysaccharide biosynthesis WecB/TagA/CpsF family protein